MKKLKNLSPRVIFASSLILLMGCSAPVDPKNDKTETQIVPVTKFDPPVMQIQGVGSETGNGGDVMICRDHANNIVSIELFDYFEARTFRNIEIDLGLPDLPVAQKVELALRRLQKHSPTRMQKYLRWANDFMSETNFIDNSSLVDIPDSELLVKPQGCDMDQIAIQKTPEFKEDKRYLINQRLWKLMTSDQQAGLILHEIIYREAIEMGQKNSKKVRYFNSYLASKKFETLNLQEMIDLQSSSLFQEITVDGISYTKILLGENGKIREGSLVTQGKMLIHGIEVNLQGANIQFSDAGFPQNIKNLKENLMITHREQQIVLSGYALELYPDGKIQKANVVSTTPYVNEQIQFSLAELTPIQFHSNGNLAAACAPPPFTIQTAQAKFLIHSNISSCLELQFYENEFIKNFPYTYNGVSQMTSANPAFVKIALLNKNDVELYPDGSLKSAIVVAKSLPNQVSVDFESSKAIFYPSGALQTIEVPSSAVFSNSNDELQLYQKQKLEFNENGQVLLGTPTPAALRLQEMLDSDFEQKNSECFKEILSDLMNKMYGINSLTDANFSRANTWIKFRLIADYKKSSRASLALTFDINYKTIVLESESNDAPHLPPYTLAQPEIFPYVAILESESRKEIDEVGNSKSKIVLLKSYLANPLLPLSEAEPLISKENGKVSPFTVNLQQLKTCLLKNVIQNGERNEK